MDDGSSRERPECDLNDSVNNIGVRSVHQDSGGSSKATRQGTRVDEVDKSDQCTSDAGDSEGGTVVALPTRRGRTGISKNLVELELSEHTRDLIAFKGAYSRIHARVLEVRDEGRLMKLVNWSGTSAVMGSLELAIHAIERTVDELKDLLKRLDAGAIIDSDKV